MSLFLFGPEQVWHNCQVTKLCFEAQDATKKKEVSFSVLHQTCTKLQPFDRLCNQRRSRLPAFGMDWLLKCGQNLINGAGASGDESKSKSFFSFFPFFFLIHRVAFLSLCSQTVCFCHLPRHKMWLRNARLCGCALKCNHPKIHFTCSCLRLPGKRARVFSVRCADGSPPRPP